LGSKNSNCTIPNKIEQNKTKMTAVYERFGIKAGSKTVAETCFCQNGRNPGRNLFLPGRFKPVLAETCQPCSTTAPNVTPEFTL